MLVTLNAKPPRLNKINAILRVTLASSMDGTSQLCKKLNSQRPVLCARLELSSMPPVCESRYSQVLSLRSEEHTSELQSLMRISYAVFCLKNTKITKHKCTHVKIH